MRAALRHWRVARQDDFPHLRTCYRTALNETLWQEETLAAPEDERSLLPQARPAGLHVSGAAQTVEGAS